MAANLAMTHGIRYLRQISYHDINEIRDLIVDEWPKESHGNVLKKRFFGSGKSAYFSSVLFAQSPGLRTAARAARTHCVGFVVLRYTYGKGGHFRVQIQCIKS